MAFIHYAADDEIDPNDRVPDRDNIIRIHGVTEERCDITSSCIAS